MANELDEVTGPIREEGRDVHVIDKQIPVTVGPGSMVFEIMLWVLGIIPGLIFTFMKQKALSYFQGLQQEIQAAASTIDNYQVNRVVVLQNAAKLVEKATDLDKETFTKIAAYRSGTPVSEEDRIRLAGAVDVAANSINVALEAYPDLKAHSEIRDAMSQNERLQREVTAARELYNGKVMQWNKEIFIWPLKKIVAARQGYTTRIPFTASKEMKERSEGVFF